jgi:hypothetical protein
MEEKFNNVNSSPRIQCQRGSWETTGRKKVREKDERKLRGGEFVG